MREMTIDWKLGAHLITICCEQTALMEHYKIKFRFQCRSYIMF